MPRCCTNRTQTSTSDRMLQEHKGYRSVEQNHRGMKAATGCSVRDKEGSTARQFSTHANKSHMKYLKANAAQC